jgi:hypothetical protein
MPDNVSFLCFTLSVSRAIFFELGLAHIPPLGVYLNKFHLFSFLILIQVGTTLADTKKGTVIYGDDNRTDIITRPSLEEMGRAIAIRISDDKLEYKPSSDTFSLSQFVNNVGATENLCKDEPYFNYPAEVGDCTAFLIDDETLLSAGHCYEYYNCNELTFAFDYKSRDVKKPFDISIATKDIYYCKDLKYVVDTTTHLLDYAIIKLDRKVTDRTPLKLRTSGKVKLGEKLFTMGYPLGMPLQVTENAFVIHNSNEKYFSANLDSFHGNSGSPVINDTTGLVEGILVRGRIDFTAKFPDKSYSCRTVNQCKMNGTDCIIDEDLFGEDVTRITSIITKLKKI